MIIFRKAVLIIHGFAGGTYDEEFLAHYLESDLELDMYAYTLPGHDHIFNNKATCEDWIQASENMVEMLIEKGYREIDVVGHSMGGVIATYLATKYTQVKKVVLIAPAFRYLNFEEKGINFINIIKLTPEILGQYGKDEITTRLTKLPFSTVKEFIKLVAEYQNTPELVTVPTIIIQGTKDKIVFPKTAKYVYEKLATEQKKIIYVTGSTHDVLREEKQEIVSNIIMRFLKHNIDKIENIDKV